MTVTFIDSPNSVIGKTEALDFTASGEVIAISVGFGAVRDEERVYRDGAFLRSYTRSTKVGNTYSIVRDGGWPANPQLYVDEAPALPSTFWTTLYDKDLRTLPNQTVSASMSNTFANFTADGQPWCFHGCTASLMIVNGQGMVGTVNDDARDGSGYSGLHVSMKLYQMAGYDVAKETAVQVRFSDLVSGAAIGGASVWCSPSEVWGYGPGDEAAIERWYEAPYNVSRFGGPGSTGADVSQISSPVAEYYSTIAFAVSQLPTARTNPAMSNGKTNYRAGYFKRGASPTVWPSMESMTPNGGTAGRTDISVDALKMGWYAGVKPFGTNKTITATHIRVLQRPVT
jgi:hypothetical protein